MLTINDRLSFSKPAIYRITVKGTIDSSWSDGLSGMNITTDVGNSNKNIAILEGYLPDQAALAGVLDTLYNLHLAILSVEYIKSKDDK